MLVAEGLGKYCDSEFVGQATREIQEALDMTLEEMNSAARELLAYEQSNRRYNVNTVKGFPRSLVNVQLPSENVFQKQ